MVAGHRGDCVGQSFDTPSSGVQTQQREPVHPFTADGLPRTLWWDDTAAVLYMIAQTLLPGRCEVLTCADLASVAQAIRTLAVRGAPAIGVAAAYGVALGAREAL